MTAQAEVIHRIQFCAGKFCASKAPLTIAQQLELNQQYESGNLISKPLTSNNIHDDTIAFQTHGNTFVITNFDALDSIQNRNNRY